VVFLVPALLLTLSTAVCAWDRSRIGAAFLQLRTDTSDVLMTRLRTRPTVSVALPGRSPADALNEASDALGSLGLRVSSRDGVLVATRWPYAGLGSALFHWALVGLFVVAGVGQLTKWEGLIGIPVGHGVTDTSESYGLLVKGPLAQPSPSTGYTIAVDDMETDLVVDGVERGHAPDVVLRDGDRVVARGLVYPNSPLHYRGIYIHREEWGLGVVASVVTSEGAEVGRRNFLFDFVSAKDGRIPIDAEVPPELGVESMLFEVPLDEVPGGRYRRDLPADPRLEVRFSGSSGTTNTVLRAGDTFRYPGAQMSLRVVDVDRYARFLVAYDPTIPWVYAFLVLAMIGCALALLAHPRAVLLRAEESEGTAVRLDALVIAKRMDPLFKERVQEAMSSMVSDEGES